MGSERPRIVLPVIVASQFAGTSLWFATNAVVGDLQSAWELPPDSIGLVTSSVQLGFIIGTLVFAISNVADRFQGRVVFLVCALLGALANAAVAFEIAPNLAGLAAMRFAVGFFLAGIYPVGMKIAASWYARGLGQALGLLVGALVLGTAFPHILRAGGLALPWRTVIFGVSGLAALGGVMLYTLVPPGPHLPKTSPFDPRALRRIAANADFRAAAFGYFGHMWEIYALWAFTPVLLTALAKHHETALDVPLWSFVVIAAGAVGCAGGGLVSRRVGSAPVAAFQIGASGVFCLAWPLVFTWSLPVGLAALVAWGVVVAGDSPQFSALTAATAPRALVGTALTIVTCIGFFITVPSIQLTAWLSEPLTPGRLSWVWAVGPILGLLSLRRLLRTEGATEARAG